MTRSPIRHLALVATAIVAAALPPAVAAADVTAVDASATSDLVHGWKIQSSAVATGSGAEISQPGYAAAGWFPISQPETVMAGLLENGKFPDIFHSNNLASVSADPFKVNWWYRDVLWL